MQHSVSESEEHFRPPTWEEIMPDPATFHEMQEGAREFLEKVVPQTLHQRLGATLPHVPPEPLSNSPLAARCWFDLQHVVAEYKEGLTARQLAKLIGHERYLPSLIGVLDHLAKRGELRRSSKGAIRYHAKSMVKVLPPLLRQFPRRLPSMERDTFDMAVLTYQESAGAEEWQAMAEALVSLVKAIPGWPEAIAQEVETASVEWLRLVAGVEPPGYVLDEADPLVTGLRQENYRLQETINSLHQVLEQARADLAQEKERADRLEAENWDLLADEDEWPQGQESPYLEDFLAGRGRGDLPEELSEGEVARVRGLLLSTKANRPAMLAIAAGLSEVYHNPTGHQRLTTLSFKDHPFDSLWRARVGKYRVVYGLIDLKPYPIVIGTRGEVYELTVHALKNKHLLT